jgi:hypothetical protein
MFMNATTSQINVDHYTTDYSSGYDSVSLNVKNSNLCFTMPCIIIVWALTDADVRVATNIMYMLKGLLDRGQAMDVDWFSLDADTSSSSYGYTMSVNLTII